ncbi:MAG: phosphoenolpyruvate carboxylase [Xenococcus sp. (in: cyanobacteria)]
MGSLLQVSSSEVSPLSSSGLLLRRRLKSIEQLWESVLRSECGQEMVDLLQQMRAISSPEGQVQDLPRSSVPQLIKKLPIEDAIQAARAFALYFQLINIVEKHYEQQEQKLSRHQAKVKPNPLTNGNSQNHVTEPLEVSRVPGAGGLEEIWLEQSNHPPQAETFQWLFPHLKEINMPPRMIQRLLDQLDIRLVFTAHPTEIVRHTIRKKQRRISDFLRKLDLVEDSGQEMGLANSWETEEATNQLM